MISTRWGENPPNGLEHFSRGREHPEKAQGSRLRYHLAVHQDLELAVMSGHHVHLLIELLAESCRQTGGMKAGDSVGAVTDRNAAHELLLWPPGDRRATKNRRRKGKTIP